ncbi:hypothetical protein [Pseudoduganella sp. GCM10020061]|uniref:hypothetical protein n=1 Tax=Pseudoduganella sp. GCM10020061 TaxID=3317345 RepID=UPI00363F6DFD
MADSANSWRVQHAANFAQIESFITGHARERNMQEVTFVVETAEEGGYNARALGESIFTQAADIPALHRAVRDALRCHYDEANRPGFIRLRFVREEVIAA